VRFVKPPSTVYVVLDGTFFMLFKVHVLNIYVLELNFRWAGIATRYGLDGPGIESQWGRGFPQPSRPALGPTQPPLQWIPGLSQG
jgi:hypothetical protein